MFTFQSAWIDWGCGKNLERLSSSSSSNSNSSSSSKIQTTHSPPNIFPEIVDLLMGSLTKKGEKLSCFLLFPRLLKKEVDRHHPLSILLVLAGRQQLRVQAMQEEEEEEEEEEEALQCKQEL